MAQVKIFWDPTSLSVDSLGKSASTRNVEKSSISGDVGKGTIKKFKPSIGTHRCDFITNLWR